jgi:hypothetical protein
MSTLARAARPALKFVRLSRAPILSQLQLDEALLRASTLNWCVVNAAPAAQARVQMKAITATDESEDA